MDFTGNQTYVRIAELRRQTQEVSVFSAFYYFCVVILVENRTSVCGGQMDVKFLMSI